MDLVRRYTHGAYIYFILPDSIALLFRLFSNLPNNMDFSIRDMLEPIQGRVWFN